MWTDVTDWAAAPVPRAPAGAFPAASGWAAPLTDFDWAVAAELLDGFDLQAEHGHLVREFLGGNVDIYIFFKPIQGNAHD